MLQGCLITIGALWYGVVTTDAAALAGSKTNSLFTLYHINPKNYSSQGIAEMDTGNALGDLFFFGRSVCASIECADDPNSHDCYNPEVASTTLTITKVIADLGNQSAWSVYAKCNIGPPYASPGVYKCVCGNESHNHHGPMVPCTGAVGSEDVAQHFGTESARSNWMYWKRNLAVKTGGTWYSTPAVGEGKFWSVKQTIKQINKTCADDNIFGAVVKKNTACFDACAQPSNRTSGCFIGCFYDTTIGPGSDTTPFEQDTLPQGPTIFTTAELAALYDSSFDVCPPL